MSGPIPSVPHDPTPRKRTAHDYQFGTKIGEGSYSSVYLAVDLYNKKTYAIKVLSKKHIVKEDKIKYVNIEKTTLHRLGQQHPGIVQLYFTFQDELSLFFVLDFAEYGELLSIIAKFGSLLEPVLKFYMLQIIDAVKFIHLKGVIHRDLKPENILVGYDFNLKITDFGAAKLIGDDDEAQDEKITYDTVNNNDSSKKENDRKGSFVGTAEYVPPELLKFNECGFETDVWAIGCILFQFFNGLPPFKGNTEYLTFEKIIAVNYTHRNPIPPMAREIVDNILVFEPQKRLTIPQIQSMPWFKGVPWNDRDYIWGRKVPRFEPFSQQQTQTYNPPPQMKTGSNRNMNKSSSNYQLHSQILQFDYNLVPSVSGGKKQFQPPTRIKKSIPGQGVPTQRYEPGFAPQDPKFTPPSPTRSHQWKPVQGSPNLNYGNGPASMMAPPTLLPSPNGLTAPPPPQPVNLASQNAAKMALQAFASPTASSLEKKMAATTISPQAPRSPQRTNLRTNTAFAVPNTSGQTMGPSSAAPQIRPPQANVAAAPKKAIRAASSSPTISKERSTFPRERTQLPREQPQPKNTVTFKEISSLLEPNEKIIKLDTILKLTLSNRLINRTPGSLDDDAIEKLIQRHQSILDHNMTPVVACVSNKARVFLIDNSLDVMMVDLTANQGGDYLMYDYEFESVIVEDDASGSSKGEEVFGYLILELIKEGGDLVFLKRFSELDKSRLREPTRVVGKNGETVRLGANYGWIDCLIYAKEMVDTESKQPEKQQRSKETASPAKKAPKPATKKPAPVPKKQTRAPTSRQTSSSQGQAAADSKKNFNKFALSAAAAAAHK